MAPFAHIRALADSYVYTGRNPRTSFRDVPASPSTKFVKFYEETRRDPIQLDQYADCTKMTNFYSRGKFLFFLFFRYADPEQVGRRTYNAVRISFVIIYRSQVAKASLHQLQ